MDGSWESAAGDGDSGGGVREDGRLCYEEAEYGRAIHCNAEDYGPMRGDGADDRGVSSYKMVRTLGTETGGIKGGGGIRRRGNI